MSQRLLTLTLILKPPNENICMEENHISTDCVQADNISALLLAMTHEGALLLAANRPPLLRCFA